MLGHDFHELFELHSLHEAILSLFSGFSCDDLVAVLIHIKCSEHALILRYGCSNGPCLLVSLRIGTVALLADAEHLIETVYGCCL